MRTNKSETTNESKVMPCPMTAADVAIAASNPARQKRYRQLHRRFDYVPAPDVLPIIEAHLSKYPNRPVREILDAIVRTAQKHLEKCVTGNTGSKT